MKLQRLLSLTRQALDTYGLIQDGDRIAVIDGARICEQGTPAELIARDGEYAALCRAQHLI